MLVVGAGNAVPLRGEERGHEEISSSFRCSPSSSPPFLEKGNTVRVEFGERGRFSPNGGDKEDEVEKKERTCGDGNVLPSSSSTFLRVPPCGGSLCPEDGHNVEEKEPPVPVEGRKRMANDEPLAAG